MSRGEDFLAAALKAIACTPNGNPDERSYREQVVEPTRRIRALHREAESRPVSDDELREAMGLLRGVLASKRVPAEEREERIREAIDRGGVGALFEDALEASR